MSGIPSIRLHWWHFPPYMNYVPDSDELSPNIAHSPFHNIAGVLPFVLKEVLISCELISRNLLPIASISADRFQNPSQFEQLDFTANNTGLDIDILMPFSSDHDSVYILELQTHQSSGRPAEFVPLVDCPGSVFFYKATEEPPGSDLLTVILQGWPMLVFILLGAGYSGIIIWLLDRLWNPSNFPKPFIRGFWEGFWWAFVTMTTVGYGDTTPRSFQARMFGLVWIVVGITILSVFTATVTTVLTQESLGTHYTVSGNEVGIVNGTEDYRLVFKHGGKPAEYSTFEELVTAAKKGDDVKSVLYDQFAFASEQTRLGNAFLVETILANPVTHGVMVVGSRSQTKSCLVEQLKERRGLAFRELVKHITPLTAATSSAQESAQSLFQPKTLQYMWYGLAFWVFLFVAFILWEFLYWRPKHKRRKEMKRNLNLEQRLEAFDTTSITSDSDNASCFPKRPSYFANKQMAQLKRQAKETNGSQPETFNSLQVHPLPEIKGSPAFIRGQRSPRFNNRKKELIEVGNLEALIRRQKDEIDVLEDELTGYKLQWETRLKDLKRQHREERRKLLRLMDHDDSIWNETKNTGSDVTQHGDDSLDRVPPVARKAKFSNLESNMVAPDVSGGALPFDASAV